MPRCETPYAWCQRKRAKPGRKVLMIDERPELTTFTITAIDDETRTVSFGLDGVWVSREWREMDRDAGYELETKEKA